MTSEPQTTPNTYLLSNFAGVLGIIGIFIYFIAWIYRWAYFGFFQLELNTLNLSHESFLIVPIQVILGDSRTFIRFILALILTIILIRFTLWAIHPLKIRNQSYKKKRYLSKITEKIHGFSLVEALRSLFQFLPQSFRHEIVVVIWILVALFWLGCYQGNADAFRDAVNNTSTRPIITLVSSSDKLALGRNLDNRITNPSLKGSRIIGDVEQFDQILGVETNDSNPTQPIVWRLLIENDNWIYIFPAMPPKSKSNERPLLLAVNTTDGRVQLLILSSPKS
jgi:hypothetical protein